MTLRFMWKGDDSNTGNCPALYDEDGGYVVQGKFVDGELLASYDLGAGQTAVWVPADVLNKLMPDDSTPGVCEAVHPAPGGYIVVGARVDDDTRGQLRDFDTDEDAVFVPAAILDQLKG